LLTPSFCSAAAIAAAAIGHSAQNFSAYIATANELGAEKEASRSSQHLIGHNWNRLQLDAVRF
jgi:hypothetical protein